MYFIKVVNNGWIVQRESDDGYHVSSNNSFVFTDINELANFIKCNLIPSVTTSKVD